jgi:hypothetical protein
MRGLCKAQIKRDKMNSNIKQELHARYSFWHKYGLLIIGLLLGAIITYDITANFVMNRLINTETCFREESVKQCADRVGIEKELFTYKNPYHAIITK